MGILNSERLTGDIWSDFVSFEAHFLGAHSKNRTPTQSSKNLIIFPDSKKFKNLEFSVISGSFIRLTTVGLSKMKRNCQAALKNARLFVLAPYGNQSHYFQDNSGNGIFQI